MATIIQPVRNLPNGTRINGVAHFCQSTNPLSRVDGSPLVVGDRNYRADLGVDTFWNGTYWLGNRQFITHGINTGTLTVSSEIYYGNMFADCNKRIGVPVFLSTITTSLEVVSVSGGSIVARIRQRQRTGNNAQIPGTGDYNLINTVGNIRVTSNINFYHNNQLDTVVGFNANFVVTGTISYRHPSYTITWFEVFL
jgi:hypothetical protein